MSGPIFQSAGQALHVAYLLEIMPPAQRVSTQVLIESIKQQLGRTEARIASTINTAGLSPLEFRGQCAMVRASAQNQLTPPEHDAVRCRYGHQRTKADGVRGLCEYIRPQTGIDHEWALLGVAWSVFHKGSQRAPDRWSLGRIYEETGVPEPQLRKARDILRLTTQALEARADARLTDFFTRTGLVLSDATLQEAC